MSPIFLQRSLLAGFLLTLPSCAIRVSSDDDSLNITPQRAADPALEPVALAETDVSNEAVSREELELDQIARSIRVDVAAGWRAGEAAAVAKDSPVYPSFPAEESSAKEIVSLHDSQDSSLLSSNAEDGLARESMAKWPGETKEMRSRREDRRETLKEVSERAEETGKDEEEQDVKSFKAAAKAFAAGKKDSEKKEKELAGAPEEVPDVAASLNVSEDEMAGDKDGRDGSGRGDGKGRNGTDGGGGATGTSGRGDGTNGTGGNGTGPNGTSTNGTGTNATNTNGTSTDGTGTSTGTGTGSGSGGDNTTGGLGGGQQGGGLGRTGAATAEAWANLAQLGLGLLLLLIFLAILLCYCCKGKCWHLI